MNYRRRVDASLVTDGDRQALIGAGFVAAYATLREEDEAMTRACEAALSAADPIRVPAAVAPGDETSIRDLLPSAPVIVIEHGEVIARR